MFNLLALIINIIISVIFLSPALWLAGRVLAGRGKAKFSDAVAIIVVGIIVGAIFDAFVMGFFGLLFSLLPLGAFGFWLFPP